MKIEGPYADGVWSGNVAWKVSTPGDFPATGYIKADPLLVADTHQIQRPKEGSPILGAALGSLSVVSVDLDGQERPTPASIGADEVLSTPAKARWLTAADVGPLAPILTEEPKP